MTLHFAICPGCKTAITLPEGYVNFQPWLLAHVKTCPKKSTPRVVARVRRAKEKAVRVNVVPDETLQTREFLAEVGAEVGARLINEAINAFFRGRAKP
jgi:hypothetical protein